MTARGTPYLAVEVRGTLPQRLLASCAAQAAAAAWGRRLLLVWPEDAQLAASFDELFAAPSPHALPRLRAADLALFPPRFWANLSDHHHAPPPPPPPPPRRRRLAALRRARRAATA